MKNRILLILLSFFSVVTLHAEDSICNSRNECLVLRNQIDKRINELTPNLKQTAQGHVFRRSLEFANMGQAWQDPSGTIWSDLLRTNDGIPEWMTYWEAKKFCQDLGGTLPTKADYIRLIGFMGAIGENLQRFTPQILPHLQEDTWLGDLDSNDYSATYKIYYFKRSGSIDLGAKWDGGSNWYTVRCIKK